MSIGSRMRQRRHELQLSQRDLAALAKVKQATISELESGRQRETSTGTARRLARALGVSLDWLIGPYVEGDDAEQEAASTAVVGA